eukprot:Gb_29907 [translate_table: standard]
MGSNQVELGKLTSLRRLRPLFPKWVSTTGMGGAYAILLMEMRPLHGDSAVMSPVAKSKSKEKSLVKDRKVSSKHSATNGGTSASAYNPVSGTFHVLESVTADSGGSSHNGRFRTIDDNEDYSGSIGMNTDCDSVSNNGSCSGESEDPSHHGKDKNNACKPGFPPGMVGGNDKRNKIRNKNEKKHQRQKERRAQELRDRCTGYLMSRKLEALSQQLIGMGFSAERSTMALILNEGRVEQSVAWLLEGGQVKEDLSTGGNLKIDISEELAHITVMEIKYKCPRAEIERAIVASEGDLEKAVALLQSRWQNTSPSKVEDDNSISGTKDVRDTAGNANGPTVETSRTTNTNQVKNSTTAQTSQHQRRENKDFNYVKVMSQLHSPGGAAPEGINKNVQVTKSGRAKSEFQKPPSSVEKKGPVSKLWPPSSTAPAVSYSLANTVQFATSSRTSPAKIWQRATMLDNKTVQLAVRDPGIVTQHPLASSMMQPLAACVGVSSASASTVISSGWHAGVTGSSSPLSLQYINGTTGDGHLKDVAGGKAPVQSTTSFLREHQTQHQAFLPSPVESVGSGWSTGNVGFGSYENHMPPPSMVSSSLTSRNSIPSSLGLFTGLSSGFSGSSVDWNMSPMAHCDYTNIDWSVAASPASSFSTTGLSSGFSSMLKLRENVNSEVGLQPLSSVSSSLSDNSGNYDSWFQAKVTSSSSGLGLQDKSVNEPGSATTSFGVYEWTSPFAGKDLFSLPRQLVPSPPL